MQLGRGRRDWRLQSGRPCRHPGSVDGLERRWDVMAVKCSGDRPETGPEEAAPHYHGHRERLRARFREAGSDAVTDYELLELFLFRALPRRDVKPLAKSLLQNSARSPRSISAAAKRARRGRGPRRRRHHRAQDGPGRRPPARARRGEAASGAVILVRGARLLPHRAWRSPTSEQFRVLFLDKRNQLIADEVQQIGTVDHTPVYPREVVKRALELSATAMILVHNHPTRLFSSHARSRLIRFNHAYFVDFLTAGHYASIEGSGHVTAPCCRSQTVPSWRPGGRRCPA